MNTAFTTLPLACVDEPTVLFPAWSVVIARLAEDAATDSFAVPEACFAFEDEAEVLVEEPVVESAPCASPTPAAAPSGPVLRAASPVAMFSLLVGLAAIPVAAWSLWVGAMGLLGLLNLSPLLTLAVLATAVSHSGLGSLGILLARRGEERASQAACGLSLAHTVAGALVLVSLGAGAPPRGRLGVTVFQGSGV